MIKSDVLQKRVMQIRTNMQAAAGRAMESLTDEELTLIAEYDSDRDGKPSGATGQAFSAFWQAFWKEYQL